MQFIGKEVKERMNFLSLNAEELAVRAFLEHNYISAIINDEVALKSIDEYDLALICSVLHCNTEFFTNETIKQKDLLTNLMSGGKSNGKSIKVMANIQGYINDFSFINDITLEDKLQQ